MTPDEVLARHRLYSDEYRNCTYCDFAPWPCDAVRMAVQLQEVERIAIEAREQIARLELALRYAGLTESKP